VTAQRVCSRGGIVKDTGPDPQQQLGYLLKAGQLHVGQVRCGAEFQQEFNHLSEH